MARWVEQRGYTLRLSPSGPGGGEASGAFVRASLVSRKGLLGGWFNVREARARPAEPEAAPDTLGGGRLLSWRWLGEREAEQLLDRRLRTLEALGYELLDAQLALRGPWDWLRDLVHRGIEGEVSTPGVEPDPHHALHDALTRLGLRSGEIVEGVADVLGIHVVRFERPDPETIARVDPQQLAMLLPFLIEHDDPGLREVGERWLQSPTTAFELPRETLQRWLEHDGAAASLLAPRLAHEGLALLGPELLTRLARTSESPRIRALARTWVRRMSGTPS